MIILHDANTSDLSHIQAIAKIEEGFALFDYVSIKQTNDMSWIGQIVQPNQNISTVGGRLDPTILHGLELMQKHTDIQSVESVQVFDILILGQYDEKTMLTPRLRPLPGAVVSKLDADTTSKVISIPTKFTHPNGNSNVIGELLNADNVPLCITEEKFNYHISISGGTGSGKSNAAANLIYQALNYGKCVLVHDAKPDYGLVHQENSDPLVADIWKQFEKYGLKAKGADKVKRVGFYGKCDPQKVNIVVGFRASDFSPEMLGSLFFFGSSNSAEQNAFEGFVNAADAVRQRKKEYTLDDILQEVVRRSDTNNPVAAMDAIHVETGKSIQRKVNNRRKGMPWLDVVGRKVAAQSTNRFKGSQLDGETKSVQAFNLESFVGKSVLLVIDYAQMNEQSYALILSYFLRICHQYRRKRSDIGIVQMVDEAHRIFDNESRHNTSLSRSFEHVMREGRSVDHSIMLSLQNASQIPPRVMNNLNTKIVMRQNSKHEADAATQTMGKDFSPQSMRLGTGHALVSVHESRAIVLAQMAPSPFDLMRNDNTKSSKPQQTGVNTSEEDDSDF